MVGRLSPPATPGPGTGGRTGAGSPLILEARSVSKHFGGVIALNDVNLGVRRATVHALVGENGAGKSTLGRIFSGAVLPDAGELVLEGRPVRFATPRDTQRAGVAAVSQELTLVPQLSVIDNVFLGIEQRRFGMVARRASSQRFEALVEIDGLAAFARPAGGRSQRLRPPKGGGFTRPGSGARLVVMDEPTAALAADEVRQLLDLVQRLVRSGTTIIYVSHALDDVLEVADEVTSSGRETREYGAGWGREHGKPGYGHAGTPARRQLPSAGSSPSRGSARLRSAQPGPSPGLFRRELLSGSRWRSWAWPG